MILQFIQESRCILEIVKNGQVGFTMRTMEALFFERKLITNNLEILEADFYVPDNFFVLGHDNPNELKHWMNIPFNKTDLDTFKEKYSVRNWYKQFGILCDNESMSCQQ